MGAIYTNIQHDVRRQLGISVAEYVLLDTVQKLSARDGVCKANADYLSMNVGITERGTRKMMLRLWELGLLKGKKGAWKVSRQWIDLTVVETELSSETLPAKTELSSQKTELSSKETELSSPTTDAITKDNKMILDGQLGELNKKLGRTGTILLTDTRRSHLKARLKQFTFEQLAAAAAIISTNDHMVKGNYNTIDYLLRNDEKLEFWLGKVPTKKQITIDGKQVDSPF